MTGGSRVRFPAGVMGENYSSIQSPETQSILRMYLWWSLSTLYLHACQVTVTVGDSGLWFKQKYIRDKLRYSGLLCAHQQAFRAYGR